MLKLMWHLRKDLLLLFVFTTGFIWVTGYQFMAWLQSAFILGFLIGYNKAKAETDLYWPEKREAIDSDADGQEPRQCRACRWWSSDDPVAQGLGMFPDADGHFLDEQPAVSGCPTCSARRHER